MFRQTSILLFFLAPFLMQAGNGPVVNVADIFSSPLESIHYTSLLQDEQPDFLKAMVVLSGNEVGEEELEKAEAFMERVVADIRSEVSPQARLKDRLEAISSLLHQKYLRRYEKIIGFHKLVEEGTYNCVSATAFYGLLFHRLEIPFALVEQEDHVYLVAGKDERIIVEPTSAEGEVLQPDRRLRREWLNWLKQENLVSRQDIRRQGRKRAFEQHFFSDPQISFQQLCGIQYLNQGIAHLESKKYAAALAALEKAFPLYPRNEVTRLRLFAAYHHAQGKVAGSHIHLQAYLRLLAAAQDPQTRLELEGEAFRPIAEYLLFHHRPSNWMELSGGLEAVNVSEGFLSRVENFYHLAAGESARDRRDYALLWEHAAAALAAAPMDSLTQVFAIESALVRLAQLPGPADVLVRIESLKAEHAFFAHSRQVKDVEAQVHLLLSMEAYDQNDGEVAELHMQRYDLLKPGSWKDQEEKLGLAYSAAVRFHFRQGNFEAARTALQKGFSLIPLNHDLKRTSEIFAEELDF